MNDSPEHQRWLDADTAERILNGQDVPRPDRRIADLARLLAAADSTEAGRPEDERAALRAFAQAQPRAQVEARVQVEAQAGLSGRAVRPSFRRTLRESRTAKVVTGAVAAVFALGGVAVAAQTGALPHPFRSGTVGPEPAPASATRTDTAVAGTPGARGSHPAAAATTKPPAPVSPQPVSPPPVSHPGYTAAAPGVPGVKGLCESYLKAAQGGRRLDSPSMSRLEEAAGGAGGVDAYCAGLTGHPAGRPPAPAPHPTHPAAPRTSRRKQPDDPSVPHGRTPT